MSGMGREAPSEPGVEHQIFTTSLVSTVSAGRSPPRSRQHEVHIPAAAFRAYEPLVPFRDWGRSAVARRQLGSIRLDLVADDPGTRGRSAAERRWRAGVGFHRRRLYRPLLGGS
jgi:hypothetical protein